MSVELFVILNLYPRILKVAVVKALAHYLIIIPHADVVSKDFGPFTLLEGHHNDYDCLHMGHPNGDGLYHLWYCHLSQLDSQTDHC